MLRDLLILWLLQLPTIALVIVGIVVEGRGFRKLRETIARIENGAQRH